MAVEIRTQHEHERPAVASLIDVAFAPALNARQLADWIHDSAGWIAGLSLVALEDGRLVGHVMLSQLPLRTPTGDIPVLYLSPLSVDPQFRQRGIARALVESALQIAVTRPEPLVVLEGSPVMYSRLGFERAADFGIDRPSDLIPQAAFQLVTLPGYRPDLRGQIVYPDYFYDIGAVGP